MFRNRQTRNWHQLQLSSRLKKTPGWISFFPSFSIVFNFEDCKREKKEAHGTVHKSRLTIMHHSLIFIILALNQIFAQDLSGQVNGDKSMMHNWFVLVEWDHDRHEYGKDVIEWKIKGMIDVEHCQDGNEWFDFRNMSSKLYRNKTYVIHCLK